MIIFFLKKTFVDGWDNLLRLAICNIFFLLLAIGLYYVAGIVITNELTAVLSAVVCITIFTVPIFMVNESMAQIAQFKTISIKETIQTFTAVCKDAVLFSLIVSALFFVLTIGIPFYMAFGNVFGIFLAAVLFWATAIILFSLQWFLALRTQLKDTFSKAFKKSFIIFFDNAAFSIFMFFYSIILFALSIFLAFFVPGISGILLAQNNALRLRLYKYDWIEQHPELSAKEARKSIPWGELIADDREMLGPRTLKNLIFPWK